jgi:hypothetical protein
LAEKAAKKTPQNKLEFVKPEKDVTSKPVE